MNVGSQKFFETRLEFQSFILVYFHTMINEVTKVFTGMSDLELAKAIREMKEDSPKGIIREDGVVRQKCKAVHDIVGGSTYEHLMMTQFSILQEAAYRYTPKEQDL